MRYLLALLSATALMLAAMWGGSWISTQVSQPQRQYNDFTVGRNMDLCGYKVDMRHAGGGYHLEQWTGGRCSSLSDLEHCVLKCLSVAGTVEIGAACFSDCVEK